MSESRISVFVQQLESPRGGQCACLCVRPSWRMSTLQMERGRVMSLFSCWRARRVKSCRGCLTHTEAVGLSFTYTHRGLRCLGQEPRPRALGSHTLNRRTISVGVMDSDPITVLRVAGHSVLLSLSSRHSPWTSLFPEP